MDYKAQTGLASAAPAPREQLAALAEDAVRRTASIADRLEHIAGRLNGLQPKAPDASDKPDSPETAPLRYSLKRLDDSLTRASNWLDDLENSIG